MVFKQSASQNDTKVVQKEVVIWMKSSSSAKSVLFCNWLESGCFIYISNL
jgi:hypothetical protein